MKRFFCIALGLLAGAGSAHAELAAGAGDYVFQNAATGQPVQVYYFKPADYTPGAPVVVVLHGIKRNAQDYRDAWMEQAAKRKLMVLAPVFSRETYRGANGYNLGNVFHAVSHEEAIGKAKPAQTNPPRQWSFALPDAVFADFAQRQKTKQTGYTLYGHGAGAQFAHRYALFMPRSHACRIISANSGWYTFPDRTAAWPYGIQDVPGVSDAQITAFLGAPLTLLLGEEDVRSQGGVMRKSDGAEAQGPERKARGERFFAYGKQLGEERRMNLAWQLDFVAGAGHSNAQMAEAAAERVKACPAS